MSINNKKVENNRAPLGNFGNTIPSTELHGKIHAPQYYDQKIPPLLEEILAGNDKRTLLECGCGDGSLLYALAKKGYLEEHLKDEDFFNTSKYPTATFEVTKSNTNTICRAFLFNVICNYVLLFEKKLNAFLFYDNFVA